jgi:hypothetical protein
MIFCWVKDTAIVHASIENGFVLNTKCCVKDAIDAQDKMDGNSCEMYFAE